MSHKSKHLFIILIKLLLFTYSNLTDKECYREIHYKEQGIKLMCCSSNSSLLLSTESSHQMICPKNLLCHCNLYISEKLNCLKEEQIFNISSSNSTFNSKIIKNQWLKSIPEEAINCADLNFPNSDAEFSVTLKFWNQKKCIEILNGLQKYKVTALTILIPQMEGFLLELPNLGLFLPNLRHLSLISKTKEHIGLLSTTSFRDLKLLETLQITNINFEFDSTIEFLWIDTIRQINIENSTFTNFPWWLTRSLKLEKLVIRNSLLDSVIVISQIPALLYVEIRNSRLKDLSKISFISPRLQQIDLSGNKIQKFAPHTFAQCRQLRLLDLSANQINELPNKAFFANKKLKYLKINDNKIKNLKVENFVGLDTSLHLLSLSGNPLIGIDPFAFLPIKSLRVLEMDKCNLTTIPLAVTQCCHLNSKNHFYNRNSMPVEVLALLSRPLKFLGFEQNPLMEFPYGLFLFPTNNVGETSIVSEILDTLVQLPVWLNEPCISFMWHLHLTNSSFHLRQRISKWNPKRMRKEKLAHCQQLYETVMDYLKIYDELVENSGCEASRRLRSVPSLSIDSHSSNCKPCNKHWKMSKNFSTDISLDTKLKTQQIELHQTNNITNITECHLNSKKVLIPTYIIMTSLTANFLFCLLALLNAIRIILKQNNNCNINTKTPLKASNNNTPTFYTNDFKE